MGNSQKKISLLISIFIILISFSTAKAEIHSDGQGSAIPYTELRALVIEVVLKRCEIERQAKEEKARPKREFNFSPFGTLRTTSFFERKKEEIIEDTFSLASYLILGAKGKIKNDIYYKINGKIFYHLDRDKKNTQNFEGSLYEIYTGIKTDDFDLCIGKQVFTWGKLDDLTVLDTLNPQDYSYLYFFDKQTRKIPVLSLKFNRYLDIGDGGVCELIWLPRSRPNKVKYFDSDWAAFVHIKESIQEGDYTSFTKDVVSHIDVKEEKIRYGFENSDTGLRLGLDLENFGFNLYYLYKKDPNPIFQEKDAYGLLAKKFLHRPIAENLTALVAANPPFDSLTLTALHPRMNIIGLDAEGIVSSFGWRYESALFLDKYFLKEDFRLTKKPYQVFGFGIDNQRTDLYFIFQVLEQIIFDYEPLFAKEETSTSLFKEIYWKSHYGKIKIGSKLNYNLAFKDYLFNPYITLSNQKGLNFSVGYFLFKGKASSTFGNYDSSDFIYLDLKYDF